MTVPDEFVRHGCQAKEITLLGLIAGLDAPTSGVIRIDDMRRR